MTQAELLLEAIKADPADDVARLAYADWLDESGADPDRAEFIRIEIEMWRRNQPEPVAGSVVSGDTVRLFERSRVLWAFNGSRWSQTIITYPDCTVETRRGFVQKVRCPIAVWGQHGRAVAAAHPLERVELTDKEPREENNGLWAWAISDDVDAPPWRVPGWLASHFPRPWPPYWEWPTREAATECLSHALILWARRPVYGPDDRAELPPQGVILKTTKRIEMPRAV